MNKILVVFGTRPEAIKMCPLINQLKKDEFETVVCVTGQHREMLDQVLKSFQIIPDYDLNIMKKDQDLFSITSDILIKMKNVLQEVNPDLILVHGDTTTSFTCSLAGFYMGIKIGHVEAGLRTYDIHSPFPEEFNRQGIDLLSDIYFAPTCLSKDNLISEGKPSENIFVTGNTGIDALATTIVSNYSNDLLDWIGEDRMILLTTHRRENLGDPMIDIFNAINTITQVRENVKVVFPVHMNPKIERLAKEILGSNNNIKLISPLDVFDFHNIMNKSYFILTDSGGIQEEAPSLGKPVLVLRDKTERPEGVEAGTLKVIGTKKSAIIDECLNLLDSRERYLEMSSKTNPYGDGNSSVYISSIIKGLKS